MDFSGCQILKAQRKKFVRKFDGTKLPLSAGLPNFLAKFTRKKTKFRRGKNSNYGSLEKIG